MLGAGTVDAFECILTLGTFYIFGLAITGLFKYTGQI